ncbi:MAG: acetoin utilization protein AcuB [Proteobacteria bacterium]|nr:MAG: acetoin utilization protein AcuB [Pseudomonadota bacterium]
MYIGRIMHTDLITIKPDASLVEAKELVERKKIDHLLVVDDKDKLVGLISDRDLKQYWASPATTLASHELIYLLEKITVDSIMVETVVTVSVDTTIERAAHIMQTNNFNSLPVMDQGELVGIITSTDVMYVLLEAIGMHKESVRIGILVKDRVGQMAEVAIILRDQQINIQSLVTWPVRKHPGVHQIVIRVSSDDGAKAVVALNKNGYKVLTHYVKDLKPYLPHST